MAATSFGWLLSSVEISAGVMCLPRTLLAMAMKQNNIRTRGLLG